MFLPSCLGGEKALAAVQARDRRKAELCARHGVTLVCFGEDDDLNEHCGANPAEPRYCGCSASNFARCRTAQRIYLVSNPLRSAGSKTG